MKVYVVSDWEIGPAFTTPDAAKAYVEREVELLEPVWVKEGPAWSLNDFGIYILELEVREE